MWGTLLRSVDGKHHKRQMPEDCRPLRIHGAVQNAAGRVCRTDTGVNKHSRYETETTAVNLIDELADVQIMMIQILYLLKVDEEVYRKKIMSKLDRQLDRMENQKVQWRKEKVWSIR